MGWNISDLREGRVALEYKGDFTKLSRVLKEAFPKDNSEISIIVFNSGENFFTGHNFGDKHFWVQTTLTPSTPTLTEKEFYGLL